MRALPLLALFSGLAAAGLEVLWFRRLSTLTGDMFSAHAALLAVFLGGVGLGARWARFLEGRLWAVEFAAGLYAVLASVLSVEGPAAIALILVPAMAMGLSVPLYAAALGAAKKRPGSFSAAYGRYNAGACLGLFAAEFLLLPAMGVYRSMQVLGMVHLFCGMMLMSMGKTAAPAGAPAAPFPARGRWAVMLYGLAGSLFTAFSLKAAYHLFLPQRENFALLTAASLAAIAAGTALQKRFKLSFPDCLLLAALSLGALYGAYFPLAASYRALLASLSSASAALLLKALYCAILALPSLFAAAALPALLQDEPGPARLSGRLLFFCGLGNAAGVLLFVFWVHPGLPFFSIGALAGLLLLAAAFILAGAPWARRRWEPTLLALALLLFLASRPESRFHAWPVAHGPNAQITVFKHASNSAALISDARLSAVTYDGDPSVSVREDGRLNLAELSVAVFPALAAPRRDKALVVGLGSGVTAGAAALLFKRTTIVEINGAFFKMLPVMARDNFDLFNNPFASLVHADARTMIAREGSYDAIINTPSGPGFHAASKLYTDDYVRLAKSVLAPGGVFAAWFSFGDAGPRGSEVLRATLKRHFRACRLAVLRDSYFLLLCSDAPGPMAAYSALKAPTRLRSELERSTGLKDLDLHFRAALLSDDALARAPAGPVNSDDKPLIEMLLRREAPGRTRPDLLASDPARYGVKPPPLEARELAGWAFVLARHYSLFYMKRVLPILLSRPDALRLFIRAVEASPAPWTPDAEGLKELASLAERGGLNDEARRLSLKAQRPGSND